jgi:hypothetical protein
MYSVAKEWNPRQKRLTALLRSPSGFDEAISLCREMHAELHDGGKAGDATAYGQLLHGAGKGLFSFRPPGFFGTVAWNLWHIARIEDAVANILIGDSAQVLGPEWLDRMGTRTADTGNAFTAGDVDRFSAEISVKELLAYRKAVGRRTDRVLRGLKAEDVKRKASKDGLARIMSEGVLTKEAGSIWLLDFWGKKTVAGLLLMPITRHQMVHINDSLKIRARYENANA